MPRCEPPHIWRHCPLTPIDDADDASLLGTPAANATKALTPNHNISTHNGINRVIVRVLTLIPAIVAIFLDLLPATSTLVLSDAHGKRQYCIVLFPFGRAKLTDVCGDEGCQASHH
jgi:hypothetical protein